MRGFSGGITQTGNVAAIEQGCGTLDQVVGLRSHNDAVALPEGVWERCMGEVWQASMDDWPGG